MRVALFGCVGAFALVAACSGASNPLGAKENKAVDGGGSGSGGSSSSGSSGGGSSTSSSSSGGGTTTCTNGSVCNDGSEMKVCTATNTAGACASITYTVDAASFTCDACTACTFAQSQASQACAEAGGGSSSGGGSGGPTSSGGVSGSGSGGSSGSSSGSASGSSSGSSSGGVVDAGDGDQTCQAEAASSCITCCQGLYVTGVNDLIADIQACDCGTSGVCQTACATEYCSNGTVTTAGDPCDTCLQASVEADGGACLAALTTECDADPDCLAYITCTNGCPAQ